MRGITHLQNDLSDAHLVIFIDIYRLDHATHRRRDLDHRLIRLELQNRLIHGDLVTYRYEDTDNGTHFDPLTNLWESKFGCHARSPS